MYKCYYYRICLVVFDFVVNFTEREFTHRFLVIPDVEVLLLLQLSTIILVIVVTVNTVFIFVHLNDLMIVNMIKTHEKLIIMSILATPLIEIDIRRKVLVG